MNQKPPIDDAMLFEALADWLATRDVHEQLDHADPRASDEDLANRDALEDDRADFYLSEFEKHGLNRIVVDVTRRVLCEEEPIE